MIRPRPTSLEQNNVDDIFLLRKEGGAMSYLRVGNELSKGDQFASRKEKNKQGRNFFCFGTLPRFFVAFATNPFSLFSDEPRFQEIIEFRVAMFFVFFSCKSSPNPKPRNGRINPATAYPFGPRSNLRGPRDTPFLGARPSY